MSKSRTTVRRILCFLLCIAMLPLVKVSAAGYNDAFQALVKWAKQGEYFQDLVDDVGVVKFSYRGTTVGDQYFEIAYEDAVDPNQQDYIVVTMVSGYSEDSYRMTQMFLTPKEEKFVYLAKLSGSDRRDGKTDSYGNYEAEAYAAMMAGQTLDDGFDMYYCDAAVSESKVLADFKKEAIKVLEFTDLILRQSSSNLSIQSIFSKIEPRSIHTVGRSWVEKAETCTTDGTMGYQCSVCGAKFYEPIKAHHNWTLAEEYVPATDVHGSGLYRCDRCGETKTDEICISGAFTDMPAYDNWAHPGIDWAVFNGITNGTSGTTFSPGQGCTRGQVVTFLWRAAGKPEPENRQTPFTDLKEGGFYLDAVAWAVENGITAGMTPDTFAPDVTCTRGQIVTFLWRFKGCPEADTEQSVFKDVKHGAFYEKAVAWASENGVTAGTSRTSFSPGSTCTRAQVVTFLYRAQKGGSPIELKDLVGVSMPTKALQRWKQDGESLKKQLEEAGYDVDLQFAANTPSQQVAQVKKMIDDGAKVIILAAIDNFELQDVLARAKSTGVKIIAYDRLIMASDAVSYYVTFDNWAVGVKQGEFIENALDLKNAGDKTYNIEFITGDSFDNNINFFYDGAMSVLQKYLDSGTLVCRSGQTEKMEVATEGWSSGNAQSRFEDILNTYYWNTPLHAVLASNDSTAQGVVAALRTSYYQAEYPVITGQDCDIVSVKYMLDDKQAMSVIKDTRVMVAKTVEMADAILKGAEVPVNDNKTYDNGAGIIPTFQCEPSVCTKDNIQDLLIDSGFYTWEELQH